MNKLTERDPDMSPLKFSQEMQALREEAKKPFAGGAVLVFALLAIGLFVLLGNTREKTIVDPEVIGAAGATSEQYGPGDYMNPTKLLYEEWKKQQSKRVDLPGDEDNADDLKNSTPVAPLPEGYVRLAAVQFYSEFGEPEKNRQRLATVVEKAAAGGAKIIALPEACIPGRADMNKETGWTRGETDDWSWNVRKVAERENGESVKFCAILAKKYGVYLTVPFIEIENNLFFDTVLLLDPEGKSVLKYRKRRLVPKTDTAWASEGKIPAKAVQTSYGKIGIMISYDIHDALPELKDGGADIVLHCCALYGHNFDRFFRSDSFSTLVKDAGVALVLSNWTYEFRPYWAGYGMARVIGRDGKLLSRARSDVGTRIVMADVEIRKPAEAGK